MSISAFNWFKIFNTTEFLATGLSSRTYSVYLTGIGLKDVLVTNGNYVGLTVDDTFLCLEMNDKSPFYFNSRAIYKNTLNDVYYGVPL